MKLFRITYTIVLTGVLLTAAHAQTWPGGGRVAGWGADSYFNPPVGNSVGLPADTSWISNIVAVAAGSFQNLGLKTDGRVIAWGIEANTNFVAGLSNVVAVAAYQNSEMVLLADGHLVVGASAFAPQPTNTPPDLQDVKAIAVGGAFLALKTNGTVVAWENQPVTDLAHSFYAPGWNQTIAYNLPLGLSNVIAISAGAWHALAIKSDGTVIAWPDSSVLASPLAYVNFDYGQSSVPPNLQNVVSVAAGRCHSLALKSDGTVVAWGSGGTNIPPGLSNVVAIAAGNGVSLALKNDGTVVEWTGVGVLPFSTQSDLGNLQAPASLSNVVAITCGAYHNLALYSAAPIIRTQPRSSSVIAGDNLAFSVSATSPGAMTFQWRFNGADIPDATNGTLAVLNVQGTNTGLYDVVLCSPYSCVTSAVATLSFKAADVRVMAVVTVQGDVGVNTRIDYSSNLDTWNTLTNFTLPWSPYLFPDWDSLGKPRRFYRVVFQP